MFSAQGKQFIRKLPAPKPLPAPELRIAVLVVGGRSYPILLDHAVMLLGMQLIKRTGNYRHNGISIQCYAIASDPSEMVWKIIEYARKAGAQL